ncbi:esterase [Streptomyces sp. ISL-22]|uniref:alpha/beta hydrolase n=1 Tax=unclassified Streptomyces TaxID=2593676 RepID=UPI001BE7FEA7|nr:MULTISPECIES: alpha/beta hydrolase-fold protein [unclassified Streptomyces]MBT2420954.1 esterase [Streptomyces sp. ISL-24]MBT2435380.1 esterase [Streptomyces sp. ISL-22]
MSLTGTPFLYTLVALCLVAVVLPLVLWSRMRGPRVVQAAGRVLMLLFAQTTAVALVFTLVNNANQLYDNWGDLLGTSDHVHEAADLGASGTGGIALEKLPKVRQVFKPGKGPGMREEGGVLVTQLRGRVSGVQAEVNVWLPPQYRDPAYRDHRFPVVEVLPGYPGSSKAWFGTMDAPQQLAPLMRSGQIEPFIIVSPRTTLLPGVDTGCANIPGKVNADSWLSIDVPKMVMDNFRAQAAPDGWAVAGYSAGAHCAAKLAVAHPDRYRAAVSMSGYNDPVAVPNSLAAKTPALRAANNPYLLLKEAGVPPRVALYFSGQPRDGYEAAMAIDRAAKPPTTVDVVFIPRSAGGHTMALWKPQVVPAFRWLTEVMGTRHQVGTGPGTTPPVPSTAGSRLAELASGTASRAAAARRP